MAQRKPAPRAPRLRADDLDAIDAPTNGVAPHDEPDARDAPNDDSALAGLLAQYREPGQHDVRVFRKVGKERRFVGKIPFDGEIYEALADRFGGGEYQCRVIDGAGLFIAGGTFELTIDGAPRDGDAPAIAAPAAPVTSEPARKSLDDVMQLGVLGLFEQMQAANRATLEAFKAMQQPRGMNVENIVAIGGLITPIVLELLKGRKRDGLSADDVARIVSERLAARGGSSSLVDVVKEIHAIEELRDAFGGGDRGGDDVVATAVKTLGPVLARAFLPGANGDAAPVGAPVVVHAPPAPAAVVPSPALNAPMPTHQAPAADAPAWAAQLADYIPLLVKVAASGEDPADFAESSIRFLMDDGSRGLLREFVARESAADEVLARFPALAAYPTWVREYVATARDILIGGDEADEKP